MQKKQDCALNAIGDLIEEVARITAAAIQQSEHRTLSIVQDQLKIALASNASSAANEEFKHKLQCKVSACVSLVDVMQKRLAQIEKADLDLRISWLESSLLGDKLNESRQRPLHRSQSVPPNRAAAHVQQTLAHNSSLKILTALDECREEPVGDVTSAATSAGSAQNIVDSSQGTEMTCPAKSSLSFTEHVTFPRLSMDDSLNDTAKSYASAKPARAFCNAARSHASGPHAQQLQPQIVPLHRLRQTIPQYLEARASLSSPPAVAELVAKYEAGTCTPVLQHHVQQVRTVQRSQGFPAGLVLTNASSTWVRS